MTLQTVRNYLNNFNPYRSEQPKSTTYTGKMWTAYHAKLDQLPMSVKKVALYAAGAFIMLASIATLIVDGILKLSNITLSKKYYTRKTIGLFFVTIETREFRLKPFGGAFSFIKSVDVNIRRSTFVNAFKTLAIAGIAGGTAYAAAGYAYAPGVLS